MLNADPRLKVRTFQTEVLFATNISDPNRFEKTIKNKISLVPILKTKKKEKRWRLLIKKVKRALKKKRIKKELKTRVFRGDLIAVTVLNVKTAFITPVNHLNYDEFCSPQEYLIKNDVFLNLKEYYRVLIEFNLSKQVLKFLKRRNFIMFDIIQENRKNESKNRINYHSVVISKQNWKNFSFVHATDLHLAERNDRIYHIIKSWTQLFKKENLDKFLQVFGKALKSEVNKKNKIKSFINIKPLKKRLINPNNQFRKFIKLMNQKVIQNDLDFIVLTGDLVDFSILSKIPKDEKVFDYEHTNWKVFKEIVLNLHQKKRRGIGKGEEILCPIFTIPGNHDYRPFHYDIRWGGMYRKIGLNAAEAVALNDKLFAFPISAILKSPLALKAYWSEINPSSDFYLKLGNNNFIFLNTGSDSFRNIGDFLTGHPSLTGISISQVKYLENIINYKIQKDKDNSFLFLHGPPINTKKKIGLIRRFKQKFKKEISTRIDEFKESILQKLGKKPSKARIDKKFNIKYGTVGYNWEKLIKFCKDFCILTLAGHTHALKEFRLGDPGDPGDPEDMKSKVLASAPPFSLKKVENPAAVFYDRYSELYTTAKDIEQYGPFIAHTPALGLGGYRDPLSGGAYREVIVKKGKLSSFKVKYLDK